jgi:DNA-binding NarL/FixJ family response regulator
VLIDLSMPRCDGLTALPLLLKAQPNAAYVILTGAASDHVAQAALAAGAVGIIGKDALPFQLIPRLESILAMAGIAA